RIYKPEAIIDQFDRTLSTELDFYHEGRTMDLFRDLFRSNRGIYIPEVVWEMTTRQVLTMEYLDGIGLEKLPTLEHAPFDRKLVAKRGAQYLLDQVFEHGIFNADPHPGNFIILRDSVVAAVDFGMIGTVDTQMKEALLDAMEAFYRREPEKLVRVFERLNLLGDTADVTALRHELANIVNYYYNIPVAHLRVEQILANITAIIRRYQISIPVDLTLVFKVIVTLEALGKELDPEFNVIQAFRPFLIRHFALRLDPREHAKNLGAFTEDLFEVAKTLPYDLGLIVRKIRAGKLRVQMEHQNLGEIAGQVSRSLNRLSFSIIIAGILIGSSLMTQVQSIPRLFGIPILALGGYLISGILGLWLIISIIRSRSV
ncbi:MAG TPA: lipopolysaccharide core heptose(II) kinase RfaY, partial [Spirochaetia bacterium]|nr:lipopolysaccharide core heptose(II) kinase RfaY [Spirochaetia bacterium]